MKKLVLTLLALSVAGVASATDVTPPAAIQDLSASFGKNTMTFTWTAPGDDGCCSGTATAYDVRYAAWAIDESNFASATPISVGAPAGWGSGESGCVDGLAACTTYWVAIKTRDEAFNWSAISNVASGTTNCSGFPDLCP
jgi:hypothetical protein